MKLSVAIPYYDTNCFVCPADYVSQIPVDSAVWVRRPGDSEVWWPGYMVERRQQLLTVALITADTKHQQLVTCSTSDVRKLFCGELTLLLVSSNWNIKNSLVFMKYWFNI